jgi:HSP20 family protein
MNFWENKTGDIEIAQGLSSVTSKSHNSGGKISDIGHLSIDVFQDDKSLILLAPVSGVDEKDMVLKLQDEVLTIVARRSVGDELLMADFLVKECYWGEVRRAIVLPDGLDLDEIDAEIKQGILRVTIPKLNKRKVKKIVI